jgi:tetratricopeptide (TPR) repeat protein
MMRFGLVLLLLSSVALAQDDLQDVLQELFGKGLNAFNKGQYAEAVEFYSRAIALDSISTNVRFNRATAYMRMGRYGEAKDDLDRILAVRPELLNARMQRAVVQAEMGLLVHSMDDVSSVIQQDSTFPKAYLFRARVRRMLGTDPRVVCDDLREALKLGDSTALRFMQGCP